MESKRVPTEIWKPTIWDTTHKEYPVRQLTSQTWTSSSVGHAWRPEPGVITDYRSFHRVPPLEVRTRDLEVEKDAMRSQSNLDFVAKLPADQQRYVKPQPLEQASYIPEGTNALNQYPLTTSSHGSTETRSQYAMHRVLSAPAHIRSQPQYIEFEDKYRDIGPFISSSEEGHQKLLDPYLTTSSLCHKPFTSQQLERVPSACETVTYYTKANVAKVRGPKPAELPWWIPRLPPRPSRPESDRTKFKTDFRETRTHNRSDWVSGSFKTESSKYENPAVWAQTRSWLNQSGVDADFYLKNTCIRQSRIERDQMSQHYCTESQHIGSGIPVCSKINQHSTNSMF